MWKGGVRGPPGARPPRRATAPTPLDGPAAPACGRRRNSAAPAAMLALSLPLLLLACLLAAPAPATGPKATTTEAARPTVQWPPLPPSNRNLPVWCGRGVGGCALGQWDASGSRSTSPGGTSKCRSAGGLSSFSSSAGPIQTARPARRGPPCVWRAPPALRLGRVNRPPAAAELVSDWSVARRAAVWGNAVRPKPALPARAAHARPSKQVGLPPHKKSSSEEATKRGDAQDRWKSCTGRGAILGGSRGGWR